MNADPPPYECRPTTLWMQTHPLWMQTHPLWMQTHSPVDADPHPVGADPPLMGADPPPVVLDPLPCGCRPTPCGCRPTPCGCIPTPCGCIPTPCGCRPTPSGCRPTPCGFRPTPYGCRPTPLWMQTHPPMDADLPLWMQTHSPVDADPPPSGCRPPWCRHPHRDTVNKRAVRTLLECILVFYFFLYWMLQLCLERFYLLPVRWFSARQVYSPSSRDLVLLSTVSVATRASGLWCTVNRVRSGSSSWSDQKSTDWWSRSSKVQLHSIVSPSVTIWGLGTSSSATIEADRENLFHYRPQCSCGKVVFLQMSVCSLGVSCPRPEQTPPESRQPREQTPPAADPPKSRHPPPLPRRPLQWTVRILLECILVQNHKFNSQSSAWFVSAPCGKLKQFWLYIFSITDYYRSQTNFAKVMFSQVSVHRRGVCPIEYWDTPLGQVHSLAQCMLGYGQQVDGTHPTGIHSC